MFCPYCHNEIPDRLIVCPECGERLPEQKGHRRLDRDSRVRRLIGLGIAAAVVIAVVPAVTPKRVNPAVTAAPTSAPIAVSTAAPAVRPTAAPVATAAPTAAAVSRRISTEKDLDALVKWMIGNDELSVKLDGMTLSDAQVEKIMGWNPEVAQYAWSSASLELTLRTGSKVLSAIRSGSVSALTAEEQAIAAKAQQIISSLIRPGMSDLEKEIAIHDYIIYNCDYEINPGLNTGDARGFFNHGRVQCSGYSDVFRLLGRLCGLEIWSMTGDEIDTPGGHEWNLIRLDGLWYAVDVTWDDPLGGGNEGQMYLNVPHRTREGRLIFDREALPEGNLAQSFDRNFYYAHKGIMATNLSEAEQLIRSQTAAGRRAEVCSVVGELDVGGLVKKIMTERGVQVSWNISWVEGPPGVTLYEITTN